ncbi:MAG TPA: hypothetical protein VHR66_32025 [Gemmataceae bacterium]|jgi:hypothetical protein|nr:hypothetical protein [Gemmataceae bacterium]
MKSPRQPLILALVLSAFGFVAMHDGAIAVAQPKAAPVAVPPQAPTMNVAFPLGAQRGQTIELTLTGTNLTDPTALWTSFGGKATFPTDMNNGKDAGKLRVKLEVPATAPIGFHSIRLATKTGISNARMFCIDEVPQIDEAADNRTKEKAQLVPIPGVVVGRTDNEVSDFFKVNVKPGQRLTFEVLGRRLGSLLDPVLKLYDGKTGREMPGHYSDDEPGLQSDARLTRTFPSGGEIVVEVRDTRHLGGADYYYRLRIAECPDAMAAMPMAVKRGAKATINFTGKHVENVPPIELTMPADASAIQVAPKGSGISGWPVPVYASDIDQLVEQEPNNDPAKANRLPVPCGITARFLEKGDVDNFVFTAKKGAKYAIVADTYEVLSPAEVYLIVKDAKGAELAKSKPEATPARIDFTAPADGDFIIYAEHLNFAYGPTEIYHLSLRELAPDFDVQLALDRFSLAPGETTLLPINVPTRRDYTGPIELVVTGPPGFSGTVSVPNAPPPPPNQPAPPIAFLPVTCKGDLPIGAYELKILAKANINGKEVTKPVTVADAVRAGLNGLPFPPREMLASIGVAVTDKPLFALAVKLTNPDVLRGVAANLTITATRAAGFAEEIQLAPVTLPANVTIAVKPIPKGANDVQFPVTVAAAGALGPLPLSFRGTAKAAGKDFAYYSSSVAANVVLPVDVSGSPTPLTLKIGQKAKLAIKVLRRGDYKGPVDVEVKNLPANVTAPKVTVPADKTEAEVELTAAANAAAADKPDVQLSATATGAANQVSLSPTIVLKVVK